MNREKKLIKVKSLIEPFIKESKDQQINDSTQKESVISKVKKALLKNIHEQHKNGEFKNPAPGRTIAGGLLNRNYYNKKGGKI